MRRYLAAFLGTVFFAACLLSTPALAENTLTLAWLSVKPMSDTENLRYQYALSKMQEKYPGIVIHSVVPSETGKNEAAAAMLEGKEGLDIVAFIDGGDVSLSDMFRQGVVADLLTYPPIEKEMEGWPDLSGLPGEEGKLFALPQKLLPRLMEVAQPTLLTQLDRKVDFAQWTWDDFFDLGDALYDYNRQNGTDYLLAYDDGYCPMWLSQYIQNECLASDRKAPDEAALTNLLSRWRKALDRGLIHWNSIGVKEADILPLFSFGYERYPFMLSRHFVPLPVYRQGLRATEVSAQYLLVNALSPQVEKALDFLAYYNAEEAFGLPADSSQKDGIVRAGSQAGTQKHRDLWQSALENGYLRRATKVHHDVLDAYQAYMKDETSLTACVESMMRLMAVN